MSYLHPTLPQIQAPQGIDAVIQNIQNDLGNGLAWLQVSFGRAWLQEIRVEDKTYKVAKCYDGNKDYINVTPGNDLYYSYSFIATTSEDRYLNYQRQENNLKERDLKIIFWFNLKSIDETVGNQVSARDYIFNEELKANVSGVLARNDYIKSVNAVYDEFPDVFEGYDIDNVNTQYLMFPYSGFRFDVTVVFEENCAWFNDPAEISE